MGPDRGRSGHPDEGTKTMSFTHAIAAAGLAALATDRLSKTTAGEVREAERRVIERRMAAVAASTRRDYTEHGRHAAPRPARA
jgi:hypothetical protein